MTLIAKRLTSMILLIFFSWYITPKEVFHAFVHHRDTQHAVHNAKGLHISSEHHHCELLKADQQFSSFEVNIPFYCFFQHPLYEYSGYPFFDEVKIVQNFYADHPLRGPPANG